MFYSKSSWKKNRTINYRFSIKKRKDKALKDLKKTVDIHNQSEAGRAVIMKNTDPHFVMVRIRPRGPRDNHTDAYTEECNATHYDVYIVRNDKKIKKWKEKRVGSMGLLKTLVTDKLSNVDAYVNGVDTSNMPVVTAN